MPLRNIISDEEDYPLRVIRPNRFGGQLSGTLARLQGNYNFKPHLGQLPDGRVIMFVAHSHPEPAQASQNLQNGGYSLSSHAVQYISDSGGRVWQRGRHIRELMSGHEPSISVLGRNVFVLTHVHGSGGYSDPYAERDHRYIQLARSTDGGDHYSRILMDDSFAGAKPGEQLQGSRNCIRLPDGRLYFGLGVGRRHLGVSSKDEGVTWNPAPVEIKGCFYDEISRSFFAEAVFFYANSGRLLMLTRVDYTYACFTDPLPHHPCYSKVTGLDNFDGLVLMESEDNGQSWKPLRAIGFPALMYPSVVNLSGNQMLLTYTVREKPPEGTGCIHPQVGLQAILFEELSDGRFQFDFSRDVIVIDESTPDSMRNAGGFGNTIQLEDGSLLTAFSYPFIDPEILELANQKAYLDPEVFDAYASMQAVYPWRHRDFVKEDPALTELYLRRQFSALFLYAQCAQKGGIRTGVARWQLPGV